MELKNKAIKTKPADNITVEVSEVEIIDEIKSKRGYTLMQLFPWILSAILLVICIVLIAQRPVDTQKAAQEEINKIVDDVGKLIVLPKGEVPTIATVTDLKQLKDQPFFDNAKVGDKVLIYTKAQKAILYDPSSNKIVEMAPLNTGSATTTKK